MTRPIPVVRKGLWRYLPPSEEEFGQALEYARNKAASLVWKDIAQLCEFLAHEIGVQLHSSVACEPVAQSYDDGSPMLKIYTDHYVAYVGMQEAEIAEDEPLFTTEVRRTARRLDRQFQSVMERIGSRQSDGPPRFIGDETPKKTTRVITENPPRKKKPMPKQGVNRTNSASQTKKRS